MRRPEPVFPLKVARHIIFNDRIMPGKYEVVISGAAGRFPGSENFPELEKNLMAGRNMVSFSDILSPVECGPAKCYYGKLKDREDFDMSFFGVHRTLCQMMEPLTRLSLEIAIASIIDAGVNPQDLLGSDTAVIMSTVISDSEMDAILSGKKVGHGIVGNSRTMNSNRLSYLLNLHGPSFHLESNWNSGFQALKYAHNLISRGSVKAAIVGASNLTLCEEVFRQFGHLGRTNTDGKTKCFSNDADGFNRAESVVVYFLQRKDDAFREYATLCGSWLSFDGSKKEGFVDFSHECALNVLKQAYSESGIDPKQVSYFEAGATASKNIDGHELNNVAEVLLPGREGPLLVGSVKSNVGHAEAASALVGLAKVLLAANSGIISPNINYTAPNSHVPALLQGNIKVVTEPTVLNGDYLAVSNINMTGAYSHLLIKRNTKTKKRQILPGTLPPDGLPRLFVMSGRNQESVDRVLKTVEKMPVDEEYIALTHNVFKKKIKLHLYRGYSILAGDSSPHSEIKMFPDNKQPLWFIYSGMGSQWPGMGIHLMKLPTFARTIHICQEVLKPKGIDIVNIITTTDSTIFDNILNSFVGIAAVQLGLTNVLREIGLEPDGIIGHSVGELGCAYADRCFTAEQMILAAYARGRASLQANLISGMMAAVGMGYNTIKDQLPDGIEVACRNSVDSCTLSGPKDKMEEYIEVLKGKGIFAKLVNVSNIAYHSRYIKPAAPYLLQYLKEVIPEPQRRSKKWISSSVPKESWSSEEAMFSSAEYHTNNLLGSVLFEEATAQVPTDAIVVEIAPHGLLQAILKRSLASSVNISLTNRSRPNGLMCFLEALGKLYLEGVEMDLDKLYPPVEFPVSRGTPSLEPLLTWEHSEVWPILYDSEEKETFQFLRDVEINETDDECLLLKEYTINNENIIPLSFYLKLIIDFFTKGEKNLSLSVLIQDVKFRRTVKLRNGKELFQVSMTPEGSWDVCLDGEVIVSGRICFMDSTPQLAHPVPSTKEINTDEVYSLFELIGLNVGPPFRLINWLHPSDEGSSGELRWTGNLMTFLDAVLLLPAVLGASETGELKLVNRFRRLILNLKCFDEEKRDVNVSYDKYTGILCTEGLEILYPHTSAPKMSMDFMKKTDFEMLRFFPYQIPISNGVIGNFFGLCFEILINNFSKTNDGTFRKINIIQIEKISDILQKEIHTFINKRNNLQVTSILTNLEPTIDDFGPDCKNELFLLISRNKISERTLKLLNESAGGYALLKGHPAPPGFINIVNRQAADECYSFSQIVTNFDSPSEFLMISNSTWAEELESKLSANHNKSVYLVGNVTSLSEMNEIVQKCNAMKSSDLIRFLFLDKLTSKFTLETYKEQLSKNLRINILMDGQWGTLFRSRSKSKMHSSLMDDQDQEDHVDYPFSTIKCSLMTLGALGLNLTDVSGTGNKLEVFDYCGVEQNQSVMGVGVLDESTNVLVPDSQLSWVKPSCWSVEEAASVPLLYSMAYYILNHHKKSKEVCVVTLSRILVHHGSLPLCQAVIHVALAEGFEVFTTYKEDYEKEFLKCTFPKVPVENILEANKLFDLAILLNTRGEGIHIVVNTLNDPNILLSSADLLGWEGRIYQISLPIMKSDFPLGMRVFMKQVCVQGLTLKNILAFSKEEKENIRRLVQDGLNNRTVKPISPELFYKYSNSKEALSLLKNKNSTHKKVIVSLKEEGNKNKAPFTCDSDKNYLILGDANGVWCDLCQWLIKRGAEQLFIILKKPMLPSSLDFKVNNLFKLHLGKLTFLSAKNISNVNAFTDIINDLNEHDKLAAVFIIGKEYAGNVRYFSRLGKKTTLVCLCCGGESLCEKRSKFGYPSLAVSAPHPDFLISSMDYLLNSREAVFYVSQYCLEKNLDYKRLHREKDLLLVSSLDNILELSKVPTSEGWRELRSQTFTHKNCRDLLPLFLLPSLNSKFTTELVKRMFHPVFSADIPLQFDHFESVAEKLYQGMASFSQGVYSLVCLDWSWALGLTLASLLEAKGKRVKLILLGARQWRPVPLEEFSNDVNKPGEWESLTRGFASLKHRLTLLSEFTTIQNKIRGACHVIHFDDTEDNQWIQQYFEKPIIVHRFAEKTYESLLNSAKVHETVNSLLAFEFKDAVRSIEWEHIDVSIYNFKKYKTNVTFSAYQFNKDMQK